MDSLHKMEFFSEKELEEGRLSASYRLLGVFAVLVVAVIVLAVLGHWPAAVAVFGTAALLCFAGQWFSAMIIVQVLLSQRKRKGQGWGRGNG